MFADALLDSHHQSRRGWATLTSFGIQAIFIACLLILPLLYTQVLPHMPMTSEMITMPVGPPPTADVEPIQRSQGGSVSQNPVVGQFIRMPSAIPTGIDRSRGGDTNPPVFGDPIPYTGTGGGPQIGVVGGSGTGRPPILQEAVKAHNPPPISVMMEGSLLRRIEPVYPVLAKAGRIQGNVLLEAIIGKDGTVQNLQVVHGHPMLVRAAVDAVRQWRYRPYVLNGSPIEVETQISVNFILAQ
jgi:periplasmic protein TonB